MLIVIVINLIHRALQNLAIAIDLQYTVSGIDCVELYMFCQSTKQINLCYISDVVDGDIGMWITVAICFGVFIFAVSMGFVYWKYWRNLKVCRLLVYTHTLSHTHTYTV